MNDAENETQFECELCKTCFKQKSDLVRHKSTMHFFTPSLELTCGTCGKVFKRKDKLQQHEQIHTKQDIKIVCEICHKQFKTKDGLKAHRIGFHEKSFQL